MGVVRSAQRRRTVRRRGFCLHKKRILALTCSAGITTFFFLFQGKALLSSFCPPAKPTKDVVAMKELEKLP